MKFLHWIRTSTNLSNEVLGTSLMLLSHIDMRRFSALLTIDHSEQLFTKFKELLLMGNLMSKVQIFSFVATSLYFCSNTSGILKINLWLFMLGFWWWKKGERETRETGENRGQYTEEDGGGGAVTVQFPEGEGQGEGAAQKGRGGPAV